MYLFEDIEKQKELKIILESWIEPPTPYKHHVGVKGLGCDCIHFCGRVFEEMGLIDFRKDIIPDYPRDWHMHNTRELLSEAIEMYLNTKKHTMNDDILNGDIILSHYGKASSHAGIYFDDYVYQSIDHIGVKKITFNDQNFKMQMKYIYRIVK